MDTPFGETFLVLTDVNHLECANPVLERCAVRLGGGSSAGTITRASRNLSFAQKKHQRCGPAEWNLREIFRFSHRFSREILA